MAANIHTYIHTHNFRQCNHASVGLAQAHPNYRWAILLSQQQKRCVQLENRV